MRTDLRSPKLTNAIRHAIDEARLADEFLRQPMRPSYALEDRPKLVLTCCSNRRSKARTPSRERRRLRRFLRESERLLILVKLKPRRT